MTRPHIKEAGDAALVLEFEAVIDPGVNARVIAAAAAIDAARLEGVRDVVPTYRSVAVYFDPLVLDADVLRATLERSVATPTVAREGRVFDVPVVYGGEDGPDLGGVASWAGLSPEAVIRRHAETTYRVFMLGFLPGFAYLGTVDARIAAPRHASPRLRVPAGSVGIAGLQTGVYPQDAPGGWQIIGRTSCRVFDPTRTPTAALLRAGDTVRFVPTAAATRDAEARRVHEARPAARAPEAQPTGRSVTVLHPGLFTTIQDAGRWGHQASGVAVSGPLDRVSHRVANALAGNAAGAATLEVTLSGPALRVEQQTRVAIAGADLNASLDGVPMAPNTVVACRAGGTLRFGARRRGARAYIAFEGGIAVPPVLGSRATHVRAGLGGVSGRSLRAGDRLSLGAVRPLRGTARADGLSALPAGGVRLRVLPGPQDDRFADAALETLERTRFTVTPQSDRMGYRLAGHPLTGAEGQEMISDATFAGGLQVPPSGEPILLLADRQTTGGYPQIATVITADLPLAGQLAPGDWVEFTRCSRAEALTALIAQEATLLALE